MSTQRFNRPAKLVLGLGVAAVTLAALTGVGIAGYKEHRGEGRYGDHHDDDHGYGHRGHGYGEHGFRGGYGGGPRGMRMFDRFDADADGKVTQAEVDARIKERIQAFDTDGNGQLSLEEFQGLWLDHTRQRMVDGFQRFDDDGDAQVTEAELGGRFRHMTERFDRNGDGAVEKGEMWRRGDRRRGWDDDDD